MFKKYLWMFFYFHARCQTSLHQEGAIPCFVCVYELLVRAWRLLVLALVIRN
jgi:hypothetical protein